MRLFVVNSPHLEFEFCRVMAFLLIEGCLRGHLSSSLQTQWLHMRLVDTKLVLGLHFESVDTA